MPIHIVTPPSEVVDLIQTGTGNSRVKTMEAEHVVDDQKPHAVFTLSVEAIAGGAGPEAATQVGWRVMHHSDAGAAVEVYTDDSSGEHHYGGVNRGPFAEGMRAAVDEAERLDRVQEDDFALCVLRIPAMYIMSLWLRHEDHERDLIIPIAPSRAGLDAGRDYSWPEFLDEIRPEAQAILGRGAHNPPPEG